MRLSVFLAALCTASLLSSCITSREEYLALYEQSLDVDGDGWKNPNAEGVDCDDFDATIYPDAPELCDGKDNDCDGDTDEGVVPFYYADADGDERGDPATFIEQCEQPEGWVENDFDCDDSDGTVYPGAEELCDAVDNDCDARVDEGSFSVFDDADGDGYGDPATEEAGCALGSGQVDVGGDCDDGDADISPDADELCDGVDNNCDGEVDEDAAVDASTWYVDADADGHGDSATARAACDQPSGYSALDDDCDDADAGVNPSEVEVCNDFKDNDCDGGPNDCEHAGERSLRDAHAVLRGETKYCYAGLAVGGGDLDGDGHADLVVGAPDFGADGTAYVVLGPVSGDVDLGSADAVLRGTTRGTEAARLGAAIAVGDVRGDTDLDLLVGAPGWQEDSAARSVPGGVFVWTSPPVGTETANDANRYLSSGGGSVQVSDNIGAAIVASADLSGDGVADAVVGAPESRVDTSGDGAVMIYLGRQSDTEYDYSLNGSDEERAGSAVAVLDDANGDGLSDVLVGAPSSGRSGSQSGASYLVHGLITSVIELDDADATIVGATGDEMGAAVGGVGDMNGDGYGDLVICAPNHDTGGSDAGAAFLFFGPVTGEQLPGDADLRVDGHASQMNLCSSVLGDIDVNQDGALDLLVGATGHDRERGAVFLFEGPLSASTDSAAADAVWEGTERGDRAGAALAGVGDVDGDGYPDLLVSAPWNGDQQDEAGATYLILGAGL